MVYWEEPMTSMAWVKMHRGVLSALAAAPPHVSTKLGHVRLGEIARVTWVAKETAAEGRPYLSPLGDAMRFALYGAAVVAATFVMACDEPTAARAPARALAR